MAVPQPSGKAGLEQAFGLFSEVSERLADSYRLLESRVAQLTQELAEARAISAREQGENGRLNNRLEMIIL